MLNIYYINQSSGSEFGLVRVGRYIDTSILTMHLTNIHFTRPSDSGVRCSLIDGCLCTSGTI